MKKPSARSDRLERFREAALRGLLRALIPLVGPRRKPIEAKVTETLRSLYNERDFEGMIGLIKAHLGLRLVRLSIEREDSSGPNKRCWVTVPPNLPKLDAPRNSVRDVWIVMHVYRPFFSGASFEEIVRTIVYELSGVVLSSARKPIAITEEAMCLTAMLFGFGTFFVNNVEYVRYTIRGTHRLKCPIKEEYVLAAELIAAEAPA